MPLGFVKAVGLKGKKTLIAGGDFLPYIFAVALRKSDEFFSTIKWISSKNNQHSYRQGL